MSLNARKVQSSGGGNSAPAMEAGAYPARLVRVMSTGLQPQRPYQGEDKPPRNEVDYTYEFSDEFLKDEEGNDIEDKPRWLSESLPFHSLDNTKAKSTMRYYAMDPNEEFRGDVTKLIGLPVVVNIIQHEVKSGKGKGQIRNYIRSTSSMRTKEADKLPKLVNPSVIFDIDEPDMDIFKSLPEWLQDKMKANLEFAGSALDVALGGNSNTDTGKIDLEKGDEDW